jgi:hypothetical protein
VKKRGNSSFFSPLFSAHCKFVAPALDTPHRTERRLQTHNFGAEQLQTKVKADGERQTYKKKVGRKKNFFTSFLKKIKEACVWC